MIGIYVNKKKLYVQKLKWLTDYTPKVHDSNKKLVQKTQLNKIEWTMSITNNAFYF